MLVDDQDADRWPPSRSSTGISRQNGAPELDDFSFNELRWASAARRAMKRPRTPWAREANAAEARRTAFSTGDPPHHLQASPGSLFATSLLNSV